MQGITIQYNVLLWKPHLIERNVKGFLLKILLDI
jgi:hypothetical protein